MTNKHVWDDKEEILFFIFFLNTCAKFLFWFHSGKMYNLSQKGLQLGYINICIYKKLNDFDRQILVFKVFLCHDNN